eukprot:TRINITY_DN14284_c0_g1_i3.p1 TRINITY_DN14284_c0_g1~~TRINITY_DN14284_c0_g1_i3.p1  ORF type:complete len:525 (+),score=195.54 TRINITY_DN14284_c0_g1_i3:367-1941(+)
MQRLTDLLEAERTSARNYKEENEKLKAEVETLNKSEKPEELPKDLFITDMKCKIEDMEKELEAKMKEIEKLREANSTDAAPLDLHIEVQAPEYNPEVETSLKRTQEELELAVGELRGLRAVNAELEKTVDDLKACLKSKEEAETEYKRMAQRLEIRREAAEQSEEHSSHALNKLTDSLNKLKPEFEAVKAKYQETAALHEQLTIKAKSLEEENAKKDQDIEELSASLKRGKETREEMRGEIAVLIKQCVHTQNLIKSHETQMMEQKETIEVQEVALQHREEEAKKREAYMARLAKQLEDKREQIRIAQLKVKQYPKNSDSNRKIAEIDKEMRSMKEMIRNNQYEILVKNKEIAILKDNVNKLKVENEMQTKFISTFANREDEEQAKELKKLEDLADNPEEIGDGLDQLPLINPQKNPRLKVEIPVELRKNYMRRYNTYIKSLEDHELSNNSSIMRGLLGQGGSEHLAKERKVKGEVENVDDIIRRSLAVNTDRSSRRKVLGREVRNSAVITPVMLRPHHLVHND